MVINFIKYLLFGTYFGVVLTKAEVISWFRIQEMFRLESFHMYGVIGSAVVTGMVSYLLLRRYGKTHSGDALQIHTKEWSWGQMIGGFLFGLGWALTGACPGPLYALVGSGQIIILVPLFFALVGTWVYGWLNPRLPH